MDLAKEFEDLLTDAVEETGADLSEAKNAFAAYLASRAEHLETCVGEPGFGQAVRAERNSAALRAGLNVSDEASAVDQRLIGLLGGALRLGAIALRADSLL